MITVVVIEIGSRRTRTLCAALADAGVEVLQVMELADATPDTLRRLRPDGCIVAAESPALEQLNALCRLRSEFSGLLLAILPEDDLKLHAALLEHNISAYVVESISPALLRSMLEACLRRQQREIGLTQELLGTKAALEKRVVVDRARCLLMERHGLSEKDAYRQLQQTAMSRGLPMAELARQVLLEAAH